MTIRHAHNQFIRECRNGTVQRRSEVTLANYSRSIELLLKLVPVKEVQDLTEHIMRRFIRIGEDKRRWKVDTHIFHRKNIRVFTEWCITKKYLSADPFINIPYPAIPRRLPKFYTENEMEHMLYVVDKYANNDFTRQRNRAMFAMLILTGVRRGEMLGVRLSDLDFDSQFFRVRFEHAKNRADRVIPMMPELTQQLKKYLEVREVKDPNFRWLWVSDHGKPFTEHGWKHLVLQLSREAGFSISSHKIRHTFATNFCRDGGDIRELQQILGHRDITTTMIYAHTMPEDLRASMMGNRLNNLF